LPLDSTPSEDIFSDQSFCACGRSDCTTSPRIYLASVGIFPLSSLGGWSPIGSLRSHADQDRLLSKKEQYQHNFLRPSSLSARLSFVPRSMQISSLFNQTPPQGKFF